MLEGSRVHLSESKQRWASMQENLSSEVYEQQRCRPPAHPRSLISSFIIRSSESIISMLTTSEFSIFQLVTVSVETDFSLALSETPKTGFSHDEAQVYVYPFYTFLPVFSHFLHLGYKLGITIVWIFFHKE